MKSLREVLALLLLCVCATASAAISSGYYRIYSNSYDDKYITEDQNEHTLATTSKSISYAQVWYLSVSGSKVTMQNALTGRYVQSQTTASAYYATGTSSYSLTYTESSGTYIFRNSSNSWGGLHCSASQSYNVVYWDTSAEPNKWLLEEVTWTDEDAAVVAEFQDMQANASAYTTTLQTFFSDYAYTTLNSTYSSCTDAELRKAMANKGLPSALQEMAVCVKNGTWNESANGTTYDGYERDFRIHDYDIWSNSAEWTSITQQGRFARLFHPSGIQATAGSIVYLFVGSDVADSDATLEVEFVEGTNQTGSTQTLTKGCNALYVPTDCEIFISYLLNNTDKLCSAYPDITVHIEGGTCTGCFDMQRGHTDDDWAWLVENMFTGTYLHVKGNSVLLNLVTERVTTEESPVNVMRVWDYIFNTLQSLSGCDQWKEAGRYKMMANPFDNLNGGNPHWSSFGSSHPGIYSSSGGLFNSASLRNVGTDGGSIWVIEHELGHGHQGPINMAGLTESTNNSLAQMVNFLTATATDEYGAIFDTPRSSRGDGVAGIIDRFNNGYSWIDLASFRTQSGAYNDVWVSNRMIFQLWMYFDLMKNYQSDTNNGYAFMSALFDAMRADPLVKSSNSSSPAASNDDWLKLAKYAAQITETDLSEFFEVYGMWEIEPTVENENDIPASLIWYFGDYGSYYVQTNQDDADAVKTAMQAYETKAPSLIFLEDRCTGSTLATYNGADASTFGETGYYETYDDAISGTYGYNISGTTITLAGATGAVGFKIYDADGNLVALANSTTFTMSKTIAAGLSDGTYTIVAVQGDGTTFEVALDTTIEVDEFPVANVWYKLCTPLREGRYLQGNGAGKYVTGTATITPDESMNWQFVLRDDGSSYDIVNYDGSYLATDVGSSEQFTTMSTQPSAGWKVKAASADNLYVIYSGSVQLHQANYGNSYIIMNWGGGSNTSDAGCQYFIEEVADISTTALAELSGCNASVSSTAASSIEAGQWYVMFDRGANHGYLYESSSSNTLYNTSDAPSSGTITSDNAKYLVRLVESGLDDVYYLQTGLGNYFYLFSNSVNVPTTAYKSQPVKVAKIADTDGHFYLRSYNGNVVLDANAVTSGDATVVGWGTSIPTSTGGNNDWAFYPVTVFLPGDVNLDGSVTIADVTALVNIILGKSTTEHGNADINSDGSVTIADVTALVNIILGK